ncbi:MAG: DUF2062 domain-containing protein [Chthoniobacterales bacterium]|nr:DUF2062 domain-containing protein [Chthoniobacterales bacterium]
MPHDLNSLPHRRSGVIGWIRDHALTQRARIMSIDDTAHSVALGSAIGMFFGFTPLFGLKTLLSILVAWLFKSNKIAAAITVTLHDLILPAAPVILLWEYKMGIWALHGAAPQRPKLRAIRLRDYMEWTTFFTVGQPILIGSLFLALPSATILYFLVRGFLFRTRSAGANVHAGQERD